jgi:SAM-dependent methyltransferase
MSYDEDYFSTRESWRDWRIEAHELIRLARIQPATTILDLGCGGGGLLRMAWARGANVMGGDTLEVALRLALKISRAKIDHASARLHAPLPSLIQIAADNHLPFSPNAFDAILGQHVIEHIADVGAALREWHRLLKPGGRVAMATPNAHYPHTEHFADDDHTHIFTSIELRVALVHAGFIIEECFTAFPLLARNRVARGVGVVGYSLFRRLPYFAEHGRTILVGARKIDSI